MRDKIYFLFERKIYHSAIILIVVVYNDLNHLLCINQGLSLCEFYSLATALDLYKGNRSNQSNF